MHRRVSHIKCSYQLGVFIDINVVFVAKVFLTILLCPARIDGLSPYNAVNLSSHALR